MWLRMDTSIDQKKHRERFWSGNHLREWGTVKINKCLQHLLCTFLQHYRIHMDPAIPLAVLQQVYTRMEAWPKACYNKAAWQRRDYNNRQGKRQIPRELRQKHLAGDIPENKLSVPVWYLRTSVIPEYQCDTCIPVWYLRTSVISAYQRDTCVPM